VRNIEVAFHVKLREYTTIGIGGAADRLVFPRSAAQVREVVVAEGRLGRPVQVLGAGSNLLVADSGVSATVLCTKKYLSKVVFLSDGSVVAEAGVMLPRLAVLCALSGLSGMELLSGIPGTVGGALPMNAGAYGQSIGELAEWVEVVDAEGEIHRVEGRSGSGTGRRNFPFRGSWCGPGSGSGPGRGRPCSSGCGRSTRSVAPPSRGGRGPSDPRFAILPGARGAPGSCSSGQG
jgi:UDP-N-acetylmuramate dehydrogenase